MDHHAYPTIYLAQLVGFVFEWIRNCEDDYAWKSFHYIYWIYEKNRTLPVNERYIHDVVNLYATIHTNGVECSPVPVSTFLKRLGAIWASKPDVCLGNAWGTYHDILLDDGREALMEAKKANMIRYIMDVCTMEYFQPVLERMTIRSRMLWDHLKKLSASALVKIIVTIRTLNIEHYIGETEDMGIGDFDLRLGSAVIYTFCERARTPHTKWSAPSSIQVALVRRYNGDVLENIVQEHVCKLDNAFACPLLFSDIDSRILVFPLSDQERLRQQSIYPTLLEDVQQQKLFLWLKEDNVIWTMDREGRIVKKEFEEGTMDQESFLRLGGKRVRAYCLAD